MCNQCSRGICLTEFQEVALYSGSINRGSLAVSVVEQPTV